LGKAFGRVEALEPYLYGAKPAAELALLSVGQPAEIKLGIGSFNPDVEGAAQVLLESGIQFDIVDEFADLSAYPVVMLPHLAAMSAALKTKIEAYLAAGGKLIASGNAGLDPASGQFTLKGFPAEYVGLAPTKPSYLRLDSSLAKEGELAEDYDYVFYDQAYLVRPSAGAQAYGQLKRALFTRTWEHFTSHQHAPVGDALGAPVAVANEQILYFAAPLFNAYRTWDFWAYRAAAVSLLRGFLPSQLLKPKAPGWVEMTLHNQAAAEGHAARKIVHVVAYHPRRSLQSIQHVDQCFPTAGLGVSVRLDGLTPSKVYLAPQGQALDYAIKDGYVEIALPPVGAHAVVVIE
jgi:hypothetical protein